LFSHAFDVSRVVTFFGGKNEHERSNGSPQRTHSKILLREEDKKMHSSSSAAAFVLKVLKLF
jgi:hypothetical protein